MYVGDALGGTLFKKTANSVVAEAPEGTAARIEASFRGEWILACKSVVMCVE